MKVAINGLLLRGQESGVHRCIRGLLQGLEELGSAEQFLLFVGRGCAVKNWAKEPMQVHRPWLPTRFRAMRIAYDQCLFSLAARVRGADILHGPGYTLPWFTRMPSVVTVYDLIALKHPELCKDSNAFHYRRVLPRSILVARRVIVPTEAVKADLVSLLKTPVEKIVVIPPGVDDRFKAAGEQQKQRVRALYNLPEKFILFVGNIEPKKNLDTLVKVFFALKLDRKLDLELVVAGKKGWKYEKVMDTIQDLDFKSHVRFLGFVPDEDLPVLYSLAECFAFPSLVEGFGLPPLEAMACGTPVVTSDAPAVLEATGEAALHAPANNAKSWREMLEQAILDRSLRRQLRQLGLQQASKFTWRKNAEKTLQVYRAVFSEARGLPLPEPEEQRARSTDQ